jgi:uncharacterized SAM-binding protein YcdF (DUF218 family)
VSAVRCRPQPHRRRLLLITDPWQLPRAARAFARQGLQDHPLALREAAGTVLYRFQGRM